MAQILGIDHKYFAIPTVAVSVGIAAYSLYRLHTMKGDGRGMPKTKGAELYESKKLLSEYIVFHYGTPEQLMPYPFGPKDALDFPKRCAELCLKHFNRQEGHSSRALDIGCAVGRSTFELARVLGEVIGIDYSQSFVDAGNLLKAEGQLEYELTQEGDIFTKEVAYVPKDIDRSRVSFEQGDACDLRPTLGLFSVVLAANLVCRLHDSKNFLRKMTIMVEKGGLLVITAPYTWLQEHCDKSEWLGGYVDANGKNVTGFQTLQKVLGPYFDLVEETNMPFFIRETCRKGQWTVAHATVWRRK